MKNPLASALSRRVVLVGGAASGLALGLVGCVRRSAAELLVDGAGPIQDPASPYPLDTDGDDKMSQAAQPVFYSKLYDPLLLYSNIVVTPNAEAGGNTAALMNPHGLPMELLAIRARIYPNNEAGAQFEKLTGMAVGLKLDMGSIPIVDANVPIDAFGTSRDDADASTRTSAVITNPTAIFPNPNVTTITAVPYTYCWRLKYPLYVPPGCVVTPLLSHLGQNHFPVTTDLIYICRTLPTSYAPPSKLRVPWVGSYNSVSFDNLASQPKGQDFSSELDIVNPFHQPLELSRLTGRVSMVFNGFAGVQPSNEEDFTDHRMVLAKLRIRARSGDEVARSPTPFNGLFPYTWRVWDIPPGWWLRPGEFYKVQLTVDPTSATAPDPAELGVAQYAVTAIGYRELPLNVFLAAAKGGES